MNKIHATQDNTSLVVELVNTQVLELKGADAQIFLQGQLSQDISKILIGSASIAGLSNPKGRLIAICHVYKVNEESFWLVLPRSMRETAYTQLRKYIMRSKVTLSQRDDLTLYGYQTNLNNSFEEAFHLSDYCDLNIGINSKPLQGIESADEAQWNQLKVLSGIPDIFPETQEHFVAQMLNLDLLNGISFNKGCYTGQEIIARMQHLGRVKRRMLLVELDGELEIGDKLILDEKSIGEVVNTTIIDSQVLALICMQLDKMEKLPVKPKLLKMKYLIPELDQK